MGWDLFVSGVVQVTPDKLRSSYSVMNKQQMRIANIRLTLFCERNTGLFHLVRERAFFMKNTCGSGQNELGRILC